MKISWLLVVPIASLSLSATAGPGGTRTPKDVSIDTTNPPYVIASGSLGSTRYDTPPGVPAGTQPPPKEIGCKLEPDLTGAVATCWAYLDTVKIHCSTYREPLVRAAATVNGDSMVMFSTSTQDDPGPNPRFLAYECRGISVENASIYLPKGP